jgi:hypothetical protein
VIAIASTVGCYDRRTRVPEPANDSVCVTQNDVTLVNQGFTSVPEILSFQNSLAEEYSIMETFRSLPQSVITNVATVCIRKYTLATMKSIVEEYQANRSVYDNLNQGVTDDQSIPQENNATAVMEEQPDIAPLSTSYHYEVDTVNGQPVRILVQERRYESK